MLPGTATARFASLLETFSLGDAVSLRDEMKTANCIISGSAALYMFHPEAFIPNDLDFYVPQTNRSRFERALLERGFSSVQEEGSMGNYSSAGIVSVSRLHKEGTQRTINLIATSTDNPLGTIVRFHSTLVMNAITASGLLCLYPLLTLAGRGIMMTFTDKSLRCFIKYRRRGFHLQPYDPHQPAENSLFFPNIMRSIGDNHVLDIPFDHGPESTHTAAQGFSPFFWVLGQVTD